MPNLINGQTPATQTILNVLEKIAFSSDHKHWQIGQPEGTQFAEVYGKLSTQANLSLEKVIKTVKETLIFPNINT